MSALFSGPPPVPAAPPVTPMPDLSDPAVIAAQQAVLTSAAARSGRASTVLSGPQNYSSTQLGQA